MREILGQTIIKWSIYESVTFPTYAFVLYASLPLAVCVWCIQVVSGAEGQHLIPWVIQDDVRIYKQRKTGDTTSTEIL